LIHGKWLSCLGLLASVAVMTASSAWGQDTPQSEPQLDLMPWPAHIHVESGSYLLDRNFSISVIGHPSQRLYDGATRLLRHLQDRTGFSFDQHAVTADDRDPHAALVIRVGRPGQVKPGEDESYTLRVRSDGAVLTAADGIGALRGMQTFRQLVQMDGAGFHLPDVDIKDRPRFEWRGLMIDVARHFEPVDVIERNLRGMAAVKMNVLHLHLSDNQGFRVQSHVFPKLTELGSRGEYYTQRQVRAIIQYADDRGITVVPEFDVPAHAVSWFVGYPQYASAPGPYTLRDTFGGSNPAFDPSNPATYEFLGAFFKEMAGLFPGPYLHIGGDENIGTQWDSNPYIQAYMEPTIKNNSELQAQFTNKLSAMITADGKHAIGWDEILQPGVSEDAVIQVWRGKEDLYKAAREGHPAVLSSGYYLDMLHPTAVYYANDPIPGDVHLARKVRANILGGEAAMWSELVDPTTIDSRIWPSTAAIAERLWSPADVKDVASMYRRLYVLNLQLEGEGLTQIKNQTMLLRQLAGSYDIGPLKVLVNAISPVQGYVRLRTLLDTGHYTIHSPLTSIADAATADPWTAIRFQGWVEEFSRHPDPELEQKIRSQLNSWHQNSAALNDLMSRSPRLQSVQPLAHSLAGLSQIGLQALDYYDNLERPPYDWVRNTTTAFVDARHTVAQVNLRVVDPIERLVVLAEKKADHVGKQTAKAGPAGQQPVASGGVE
jgi:hexosaminidase